MDDNSTSKRNQSSKPLIGLAPVTRLLSTDTIQRLLDSGKYKLVRVSDTSDSDDIEIMNVTQEYPCGKDDNSCVEHRDSNTEDCTSAGNIKGICRELLDSTNLTLYNKSNVRPQDSNTEIGTYIGAGPTNKKVSASTQNTSNTTIGNCSHTGHVNNNERKKQSPSKNKNKGRRESPYKNKRNNSPNKSRYYNNNYNHTRRINTTNNIMNPPDRTNNIKTYSSNDIETDIVCCNIVQQHYSQTYNNSDGTESNNVNKQVRDDMYAAVEAEHTPNMTKGPNTYNVSNQKIPEIYLLASQHPNNHPPNGLPSNINVGEFNNNREVDIHNPHFRDNNSSTIQNLMNTKTRNTFDKCDIISNNSKKKSPSKKKKRERKESPEQKKNKSSSNNSENFNNHIHRDKKIKITNNEMEFPGSSNSNKIYSSTEIETAFAIVREHYSQICNNPDYIDCNYNKQVRDNMCATVEAKHAANMPKGPNTYNDFNKKIPEGYLNASHNLNSHPQNGLPFSNSIGSEINSNREVNTDNRHFRDNNSLQTQSKSITEKGQHSSDKDDKSRQSYSNKNHRSREYYSNKDGGTGYYSSRRIDNSRGVKNKYDNAGQFSNKDEGTKQYPCNKNYQIGQYSSYKGGEQGYFYKCDKIGHFSNTDPKTTRPTHTRWEV